MPLILCSFCTMSGKKQGTGVILVRLQMALIRTYKNRLPWPLRRRSGTARREGNYQKKNDTETHSSKWVVLSKFYNPLFFPFPLLFLPHPLPFLMVVVCKQSALLFPSLSGCCVIFTPPTPHILATLTTA